MKTVSADMLKFEPAEKYEKGVVFSLLSQSWVELWNEKIEDKIKRYDREIFENPDTIGACVFISTLNDKPIGMASWDPRQGPKVGIIGYNCVLPQYRNKGFGKAQIMEVLKRLKGQGFKKVNVKTGEHSFFAAADKMYLACGFHEIARNKNSSDPGYGSIDYEIEL